MAADYILWLTLPEGAKPSKPLVFGSARLPNGNRGPKGRVTVVHGDKAIQDTLKRERRGAFAKGERLYRADLELKLDRKKQPNAKPSIKNVSKFERLDLAAMTGDLRRALCETLQNSRGEDTNDAFLEFVAEEPDILNPLWESDLLKDVKVITFPASTGDPATRRAVLKSTRLIHHIGIPEWPDGWPMPVFEV